MSHEYNPAWKNVKTSTSDALVGKTGLELTKQGYTSTQAIHIEEVVTFEMGGKEHKMGRYTNHRGETAYIEARHFDELSAKNIDAFDKKSIKTKQGKKVWRKAKNEQNKMHAANRRLRIQEVIDDYGTRIENLSHKEKVEIKERYGFDLNNKKVRQEISMVAKKEDKQFKKKALAERAKRQAEKASRPKTPKMEKVPKTPKIESLPKVPKGPVESFRTIEELGLQVARGQKTNPAYDSLFMKPGQTRLEHAQGLLSEQRKRRQSIDGYRKRKSTNLITTKAYKKAIDGLQTEEILDRESMTRRVGKSISNIKMPAKVAAIFGTGAALGSMHTLSDDVDDNIASFGLKVAGYTAAIGGAYSIGRHYYKKDMKEVTRRKEHWGNVREQYEQQTQKMESEYRRKHAELVKMGLTPDEATYRLRQKGVANENSRAGALKKLGGAIVDRDTVMEERAVRTAKGVMRIGKIGVGITAIGGVVSAAHSLKQSGDARQMVKAQEEKAFREKRKRQEERQRYGYGNVDMGNIIFDMFEERTGHHRMGNSKY